MPDEQTHIDGADVYVCNNCGAFAAPGETIKHYNTCRAGEAEYWEKFYSGGKPRKRKIKKDLTKP